MMKSVRWILLFMVLFVVTSLITAFVYAPLGILLFLICLAGLVVATRPRTHR